MQKAIVFLALVLGTVGCDQSAPSAPSAAAVPVPVSPAASVMNGPKVWTISPNSGSTHGHTRVLIHGDGFEPGAVVTLDDAATDVTVLSSTTIAATTPAHPIATVDIVVTNRGGDSGKMSKGYTYFVVAEGPPPSIRGVSPNAGTVGGGGEITITGFDFQPGAIVKLNDTPLRTYPHGSSSTALQAQVPAREPGTVDITVLNPDGRSARLTGGFRYAAPGTLDFNGRWKGRADDSRDDHGLTEIGFTVEKNRLVNVTCNGVEVTMSAGASISNDEFSLLVDDRALVSGRFMSGQSAVGRMSFPPCGPTWVAHKE